jgi:Ca-activated chloride channel family protein
MDRNKLTGMFMWGRKIQILLFISAFAALFTMCFHFDLLNMQARFATAVAFYQSNSAYDNDDFGVAEISYKTIPGTADRGLYSRYNLANTYYEQGRYLEATTMYLICANNGNKQIKAASWNNLGDTYYNLGNLPQSLQAYKMALMTDPDDAQVRQNFLFIYNKINRQLIRQISKKDSRQKKQDTKAEDKQSGPKASDNDKAKGDVNAKQEYILSDKKMDDLLNMVKQNEANKANSSHKYNQKWVAPANGIDY